jgi:uncharacterized protein
VTAVPWQGSNGSMRSTVSRAGTKYPRCAFTIVVSCQSPEVTARAAGYSSARYAILEMSAAFIGLPLVAGFLLPPPLWLPLLWLVGLGATWRLARDASARPARLWAPVNWNYVRPALRRIGLRFVIAAALLVCVLTVVAPARLFDSTRPQLSHWFAFLLLYPLLSVLAQELLYRRYLFHRLRELNLSAAQTVWISAIAFAAMHAIYRNGTAVVLTLIGGWFFADTYRRTRSLRLVCLEHALYGNLLFACGLWPFFSHEALVM